MTSVMTSLHVPKTLVLAALAVSLAGPALAQATTLCGQGEIDMLLIPSTGQSNLRIHMVKPVSAENLWRYRTEPGLPPLISIWEAGSATRWAHKVHALQFAFGMNRPVRIISNDENCMGSQDEFEILVCGADKECPPPNR